MLAVPTVVPFSTDPASPEAGYIGFSRARSVALSGKPLPARSSAKSSYLSVTVAGFIPTTICTRRVSWARNYLSFTTSRHRTYVGPGLRSGISPVDSACPSISRRLRKYSAPILASQSNKACPTPVGLIRSHWKRLQDGAVKVKLRLPKGVMADVNLPGVKKTRVVGSVRWRINA